MKLLIDVVIAIVILALLCAGVRKVKQLEPYSDLIQLLLILCAAIWIAYRAGFA